MAEQSRGGKVPKGKKKRVVKYPHKKMMKSTLDEVENDLKTEEDTLLQMKELIIKEICVLKAEDVTIQRLIEAHAKPTEKCVPNSITPQSLFREQDLDITSPSSLPQINLHTGHPGHIISQRSRERDDGEEFDSDDNDDLDYT